MARFQPTQLLTLALIFSKHKVVCHFMAIMQTMILTPFFKLTPLEKGKVEISELSTPLKTNYLKNRR